MDECIQLCWSRAVGPHKVVTAPPSATSQTSASAIANVLCSRRREVAS
jgi:hypothetical protein